jgi:hypothetical protein
MISIEKLIQAVSGFNEKAIVLPEDERFIQKTVYDLRREELELQRELNQNKTMQATKTVCDYTMSKEFGAKPSNKQISQQLNQQLQQQLVQQPQSTNFSYVENEVIDIPNTLTNLFKVVNKQVSEWYIYGMKNPNSFFKAVLMLNNPEYILKTNSDKINYSMTFKRELAIHLDALYKQYKYQQWNFKKLDMVNQLLNENVINYALIISTADYVKKSLIVLDINKKEYQVYPSQETPNLYYLITKDGQTFLPIMNSNGIHTFEDSLMNYIRNTYDLASIEAPFKAVSYKSESTQISVSSPSPSPSPLESSKVSESSESTVKVVVTGKPDKSDKSDKPKEKFVESKMTLIQIQELAKVRGLDITKEGKQGKHISKTKKELCDEMNSME